MKSTSFALSLILLFATAAHADNVTLKGDAVINALNSNLKNMTIMRNGQKSDESPASVSSMINAQLKMSGDKTRAVCEQRGQQDIQDCKIMMIVTPAQMPDGGPKPKPWMSVAKFTMSKGQVGSELALEQQKI